ncbi:hypothetical protein [Mangrovibacterium sp.]|uniref:hypothetical protein n=1 Tax=Mangrovibacterium sp. TaxID=1961364 RepID=UPI003563D508
MINYPLPKKKFFTSLSLFTFCLFSGPQLFAEETANNKPTTEVSESAIVKYSKTPGHQLWSSDLPGAVYLSGGLGEHFNYPSVLGFNGALDFMLNDHLSAGVQSDFYYSDKNDRTVRTTSVGVRLAYHLTTPGSVRSNSHWDVYLGASGDLYFGAGGKKRDELDLLANAHLGARYRIAKRWFLWGELSARNIKLGLSLEL